MSMTEIWDGLTAPKNKTNAVMEFGFCALSLVSVCCFAPHPAKFSVVCFQVQL